MSYNFGTVVGGWNQTVGWTEVGQGSDRGWTEDLREVREVWRNLGKMQINKDKQNNQTVLYQRRYKV